MPNHIDFDIAIIGGGLVGASLALALRGSGLRIAMVEAVDRQASEQPSYDDRTLVLNRVSSQWLREADIWPLLAEAANPIQRIHVTAKGRFGQTHLSAERHGLSEFGFVVQAKRIGMAMLPLLAQADEVKTFCPARLEDIQIERDHARVILAEDGGSFSAKLIVGADGAQSKVRQLMGLPAYEYDYHQTAIISNVSADRGHDHCAYERLTDTGPLALLPHGPGRMGLVWSTAREQVDELIAMTENEFLAALQDRFGYRLGRFHRVGKRTAYPLKLIQAQECIAPRSLLIGNAAHTIHPVSAQGFNLGLRDALVLAKELLAAGPGADPGNAQFLRHYQSLREEDQQETIRYTDTLVRLYRQPSLAFKALASASLLAHHWIPPLQKQLVNHAMGFRVPLA